MKNVVVLGAGMVGSAMAIDMKKNFNVTAVDVSEERLSKLSAAGINTRKADLSNEEQVKQVAADADLVIAAVPGFMGFKTPEAVIKAKKDVVDISFFDEDPFELDELAKKNNVTAVVDCGVAPGMSNISLGYHNKRMKVKEFKCMGGGLPFKRTWPFQYKAPFSPIDVIEEYTRPARIVEDSKIIIKPALSDPEYVEADPIGTLVSFNTDGLRTLLKTMKIPNMKEKTLRYPGHIEYMQVLKDSGFFSKDEIDVQGKKIRPIDVTAKLLFPLWQLEHEEREFTAMEILIKGEENGSNKEYKYILFDQFDEKTKTSSMARTTGYTCTAAARLVLNGSFNRKGICPPEFIGEDENCFNKIIEDLKQHNIIYKQV